jgi:hypothetical protein
MQEPLVSGSGFLQSVVGALTLRDETFIARREDERPFTRGLIYVLIIGAVVALASIVGAVLTEWTSPDLPALRDAISNGLQAMPWRQQIPAEAADVVEEQIQQNIDIVFTIIEAVSPSIPRAITGVVLQPLAMMLVWLVFGLLAYMFARLFDGTGTLEQTYGVTALAATPFVLGVVHVLPYVTAGGLTMWAIICAYLAVKHTHELPPTRAFWATVLPLLAMIFVSVFVGAGIGAAIALSQFGMGG